MVMLNQARNFARHSPHDAIARVDEVLHEIESSGARGMEAVTLRGQAKAARAEYVAALDRFREAANQRHDAYIARTRTEIEQPGSE